MKTAPSPLNAIVLEAYGGAISRAPSDATAFGHRDAMFNMLILAISDNRAIDAEQIAWGRDVWQKILPHSTGGAYVNYLSSEEDVRTAYQDERFQRLAAIKSQYDRSNLFHFNHNIPPAKA